MKRWRHVAHEFLHIRVWPKFSQFDSSELPRVKEKTDGQSAKPGASPPNLVALLYNLSENNPHQKINTQMMLYKDWYSKSQVLLACHMKKQLVAPFSTLYH